MNIQNDYTIIEDTEFGKEQTQKHPDRQVADPSPKSKNIYISYRTLFGIGFAFGILVMTIPLVIFLVLVRS